MPLFEIQSHYINYSNGIPSHFLVHASFTFTSFDVGLHGAWFLVALFVSPIGQQFSNPSPDAKTKQFIQQLRIYTCCTFLLFKIAQLGISVVLVSLRRRVYLTRLEVLEAVTFPVIIYMNAKFGQFDYLLIISLINAFVGFVASAYYTLAAAKVLVPYPNPEYERLLVWLKSLQYATFYFVGCWFASGPKENLVPLAVKALSVAYASIMNFVMWCSLQMFAESTGT